MNYSFLDLQAFAASFYSGAPLLIVPYGYTISFTDLDAGETLTQSLSITANADFILTGLRYHVTNKFAGGQPQSVNKPAARARLLITDSGSNERYTNGPVDLENYCSNADPDRPLSFPRFIQGRTTLEFQLSAYWLAGGGDDQNMDIDLYAEGILVRTI